MRNLNLCLDYSNICFRALFTCKYGNPDITSFDTEEECNVFARKVTNDICSLIKTFNPNSVFLFLDSKEPWRAKICPDYKGTRKRDDSINMKNILNTMEELLGIYKERGINVFRVLHAEADDIAALYKQKMLNEDCSSIFVSSDADWQQLICFDTNTKKYVCVYNPIVGSKSVTKLYCTKEFKDWVEFNDSMEIFRDYTSTKRKIVEAMAYNSRIEFYVINPEQILMSKILFGDDGDNVPAFFQFYNKSGRKTRLTEKKMEKVKSLLECEINSVRDLEKINESGKFMEAIGNVFKQNTADIDGLITLKKQRDYVELNPNRFPEQILSEFDVLFSNYSESRKYATPAMKTVEAMLKGTVFEKKTHSSNGAKLNRIFNGYIDKPIVSPKDLF